MTFRFEERDNAFLASAHAFHGGLDGGTQVPPGFLKVTGTPTLQATATLTTSGGDRFKSPGHSVQTHRRLAVLIDADNVNASSIGPIMAMVATLGDPIIKRAYGDWTTTQLASWKKPVQLLSIKPCQQFSLARGKNSSDCALIMDAMEILLSGKVDGFGIVSSDCDYTGLAVRAKEAGLKVYGFGTSDVAKVFRAACDVFVLIRPGNGDGPSTGSGLGAPEVV